MPNLTKSTHALVVLCPSRTPLSAGTKVVDRVSAQWTGVLGTGLEPLVQTHPVEQVLAGAASLVGHLVVCRYDGIADGALRLALQRSHHVAPEGSETVDDATVLSRFLVNAVRVEGIIKTYKCDHTLDDHQPALPLLFADGYPVSRRHSHRL